MAATTSPPPTQLLYPPVTLFKLKNKKGTEVLISNYGAIILSLKVKQQDGSLNDIVLGFDDPADYKNDFYLSNYPMFGAAVGRYGNRIKNGIMSIDGKQYSLARNMGPDHLHGGYSGFDKKTWDLLTYDEKNGRLVLGITSPDGEEGYPGNLQVKITFQLNDEDELSHEYEAVTDLPTAVNLTHHSYFNFNNGLGNIDRYFLKINASAILEQDANYTTTGRLLQVENTRYDFREAHRIADCWGDLQEYDQSFVINGEAGKLCLAAEAWSEDSGIKLEVLTTEPVVHLYTGSGIAAFKGKNEITYGRASGFCLETQVHPNAINIPSFPNTILRPGQIYHQQTVYRISHC